MTRPLLQAIPYTHGNHVISERPHNRGLAERAIQAEFEAIASRCIGPVEVLDSNPTPT